MNRSYKERLAEPIYHNFSKLEDDIMSDIVRRIKTAGEITSTADWQIGLLRTMGNSSENIEHKIKGALDASYPEMFELYDKVIEQEYTRNKDIYEQVNAQFTPYEENEQLQQLTNAFIQQSTHELSNITQSLGFYLNYGGTDGLIFTPLAQVYQNYLDQTMYGIASGAFDYNTALRRAVKQLTNSGLRTVDYASGYCSRVEVAARRAVMTGISQLTGKISDMNAEKLGTQYFEVAWHENARPTHRVWQGKIWTKEQLVSVCGLGSVTGLLGANCYHEYYPFFPGISERNWTDEWLESQNGKEDQKKSFKGKEYTAYEATQKQRNMETAMRAQRQRVRLMQEGGDDPDEILLAKAKYQAQLEEYAQFGRKMGLIQQRERVYVDMRGLVATNSKKENEKYTPEIIQNASRDRKQHERYKMTLKEDIGSLAEFRQMKYNNSEKFVLLKKKTDTYTEINKKEWTVDFKKRLKSAYVRFAENDIYMSAHALSRLPRLNKPNLPEVSEDDLMALIKNNPPKYTEGEKKLIYFDADLQLAVVKNKETSDIVSVIRRKAPKEAWEDV